MLQSHVARFFQEIAVVVVFDVLYALFLTRPAVRTEDGRLDYSEDGDQYSPSEPQSRSDFLRLVNGVNGSRHSRHRGDSKCECDLGSAVFV